GLSAISRGGQYGDGELRGSDLDVSRLRSGVSFHSGGAGVLSVQGACKRAPTMPGVPCGETGGGRQRPRARHARRGLLELRQADPGAVRAHRSSAGVLPGLLPDGGSPLTDPLAASAALPLRRFAPPPPKWGGRWFVVGFAIAVGRAGEAGGARLLGGGQEKANSENFAAAGPLRVRFLLVGVAAL